jgi:hypothetical protein
VNSLGLLSLLIFSFVTAGIPLEEVGTEPSSNNPDDVDSDRTLERPHLNKYCDFELVNENLCYATCKDSVRMIRNKLDLNYCIGVFSVGPTVHFSDAKEKYVPIDQANLSVLIIDIFINSGNHTGTDPPRCSNCRLEKVKHLKTCLRITRLRCACRWPINPDSDWVSLS